MTGKELQEHYENLDETDLYDFLDEFAKWIPTDEWDYLMKQRIKVEEKRKRSTL